MSELRRLASSAVAIVMFAWSTGCVATDRTERHGEADYRQYCGQCHGFDGRGGGPRARELDPPPADLTLIRRRHGGEFPALELASYIDGRAEIMDSGPRNMPAWGRHFSAEFGDGVVSEEMAKGKLLGIVEYLREIQR